MIVNTAISSVLNFLPTAKADPAAKVVQHVIDHPSAYGFKQEGAVWYWSAHMTMLLIAAAICILVGRWAARQIGTGPENDGNDRFITKNPFAHVLEIVCTFLRDEIARPLLHDKTDRFMPFLWTLFFFIWTCNLLGMVPLLDLNHLLVPSMKADHTAIIGGTATQNLWVTAALATIAFFVINISGMFSLGVKGYIEHQTAGAPWYVWPLLVPIELAGQFIKPIALAVRLFANMTAGHILLGQIIVFAGGGLYALTQGQVVGVVTFAFALPGAVAIFFLEVFVATLQAFIFMFLTTVFISLLQHHDEHVHEHAHEPELSEEDLHPAAPPLPA